MSGGWEVGRLRGTVGLGKGTKKKKNQEERKKRKLGDASGTSLRGVTWCHMERKND